MATELQTFIQDSIDELHVLGKQASQRIEALTGQQQDFMSESQTLFGEMTGQADSVKQSVLKLETLAATVKEDLAVTENRIAQSFQVMKTAVIVVVLSIIMCVGIIYYYGDKIADKRAELSLVKTEIRGKPEVTRYHGKDYIRIVPDSVGDFTGDDGKEMGTFAEIRYNK